MCQPQTAVMNFNQAPSVAAAEISEGLKWK